MQKRAEVRAIEPENVFDWRLLFFIRWQHIVRNLKTILFEIC